MSGGSYNYLFTELGFCDRVGDIERMAARLRELGHEDAEARTREAAEALRRADAIREELAAVWQAVEWNDSCDSSEGDEVQAVEKWRQGRSGG